jgi:glyoxalase family protein
MAERTIHGIHHITAIAGDPQRNLDFYTGVLGLRLVKLTVNFDDPGTYHFYFGNGSGAPGTILTFFPWPNARRGTVGTGQVTAIAFVVPRGSIEYWRARLAQHQARPNDGGERFGERVLAVADPDGLPLEMVEGPDIPGAAPAPQGAVEREHAIRGFHSATITEEGYEQTARLLQDTMGFTPSGNQGNRFRYRSGSGVGSAVDVLCAPDGRSGRLGTGTVHHIAWRTPDDAQQQAWRSELVDRGYNVSPIMDRNYFHSIYYREPGGVLFEIATDPPGFTIDEPLDRLGGRLMLPPQYEPARQQLEQVLPRLTLPATAGGGERRETRR